MIRQSFERACRVGTGMERASLQSSLSKRERASTLCQSKRLSEFAEWARVWKRQEQASASQRVVVPI